MPIAVIVVPWSRGYIGPGGATRDPPLARDLYSLCIGRRPVHNNNQEPYAARDSVLYCTLYRSRSPYRSNTYFTAHHPVMTSSCLAASAPRVRARPTLFCLEWGLFWEEVALRDTRTHGHCHRPVGTCGDGRRSASSRRATAGPHSDSRQGAIVAPALSATRVRSTQTPTPARCPPPG